MLTAPSERQPEWPRRRSHVPRKSRRYAADVHRVAPLPLNKPSSQTLAAINSQKPHLPLRCLARRRACAMARPNAPFHANLTRQRPLTAPPRTISCGNSGWPGQVPTLVHLHERTHMLTACSHRPARLQAHMPVLYVFIIKIFFSF